MTISFPRTALAVLFLLAPSVGLCAGAPTPKPSAKPHPMPTVNFPKVKLHTEFVVEVNHLGQVVRVKSGKESSNLTYNAQTYGNVLQIFIRRPDGSAIVGLYHVAYDYDPKTKVVHRNVDLISEGGDWANATSAVDDMIAIDKRNQARHRGIPGIPNIVDGTPKPKPTTKP